MAENEGYNGLMWALDVEGLEPTMKRATVVAIYYSLPSNQNASEGGGSTIIPQKIIPWGENAEPRVYVSPYTLKRNIRNYWVKLGLPVGYRERVELVEEVTKEGTTKKAIGKEQSDQRWWDFIDHDLFGWVSAEEKSSVARPGPINTWGAVSVETLHDFTDFNTSIKNVKEESRGKGGGIFNRQISKEFYFTSFFINPDLIGRDIYISNNTLKARKVIEEDKIKERIKSFLRGALYAMQKESGPRDKPACVFAAVVVSSHNYPTWDKKLFAHLKVEEGEKVKIDGWQDVAKYIEKEGGKLYIYYVDPDRIAGINEQICGKDLEECLDEIVNKMLSKGG